MARASHSGGRAEEGSPLTSQGDSQPRPGRAGGCVGHAIEGSSQGTA